MKIWILFPMLVVGAAQEGNPPAPPNRVQQAQEAIAKRSEAFGRIADDLAKISEVKLEDFATLLGLVFFQDYKTLRQAGKGDAAPAGAAHRKKEDRIEEGLERLLRQKRGAEIADALHAKVQEMVSAEKKRILESGADDAKARAERFDKLVRETAGQIEKYLASGRKGGNSGKNLIEEARKKLGEGPLKAFLGLHANKKQD